jgi:phosphohistidine phosphatase SixA
VRTPRRPLTPSPTSTTTRCAALVAVAILILTLTGCSLVRREPLASVSPSPTATVAAPSPIVTTIGRPGSGTTTIGQPSGTPQPNGQANWTFVVVRHANWKDDGSDDPSLTEAGKLRARRLADLIYSYAGVATYATHFRRAQDTARPTAELWKVPVTTYDMALPPADLVNLIKQQHPTGAILIVGHSETLPGIVDELCRCKIDPIPESDYANRYQITLRSDSSVLRVLHDAGY